MAWVTGKRSHFRMQWREGGKVQSGETRANRSEAEADRRAKDADLAHQKHLKKPGPGMPLLALVEKWAESRISERVARKSYTLEVEDYLERMAKAAGWDRVRDVTAATFVAYRNKLDSKGTNRPLAMLKAVLRYGHRVLGIDVDQALLALEPSRRPKRKAPPRLSDEQVAAILARGLEFGPGAAALLEHLILYGCRPVDLCRLTVSDWDGRRLWMTYRDTKNGETQGRPVHAAHGAKLDALCIDTETGKPRPPESFLFLCPQGTPWRVDWKGSATHLTSWYKANVGERLQVKRQEDGTEVGWLLPSQRGIYCLKDYGLSRAERIVGRRAAMALSQHKTEAAFKRYLTTNEDDQRAAIAAIPEPTPAAEATQ